MAKTLQNVLHLLTPTKPSPQRDGCSLHGVCLPEAAFPARGHLCEPRDY